MYSTMRDVYAGCYDVFVASGATASEMKLVPHVSRVDLDDELIISIFYIIFNLVLSRFKSILFYYYFLLSYLMN